MFVTINYCFETGNRTAILIKVKMGVSQDQKERHLTYSIVQSSNTTDDLIPPLTSHTASPLQELSFTKAHSFLKSLESPLPPPSPTHTHTHTHTHIHTTTVPIAGTDIYKGSFFPQIIGMPYQIRLMPSLRVHRITPNHPKLPQTTLNTPNHHLYFKIYTI